MMTRGANTKITHEGALAIPESLAEWEQLLGDESIPFTAGLSILDTDFRFLAINKNLAEMHGIPAEAHLGKTIREILGDFAELLEPYYERVKATGQAVLNREISSILPTRSTPGHWIGHHVPIKDSDGRVTRIGVIVVEITKQKKLEESFRSVSENLKDQKKRGQVMTEVGRLLESKWDVRQVFPQVSARLRRVLRQEYAALSLRDENSGQLVRQSIDFPFRKGGSHAAEVDVTKGPGGKAFRERASLIFSKKDMQNFRSDITDHLLKEGLQSLCCVPLIRPKGPVGVLVLGSTRVEAFKVDDLTLLNQVAAQLAIALENAATAREVERLKIRLGQEKKYLEGETQTAAHFAGIIGESPALQKVLEQVAIVATSDATVLLLGETGTGKGLIARALHHVSKRKDKAFVSLNCAAIPTGLLESELFGHEKGAFTGAVQQKVGRLELADKGTLFLDEIGDIQLELQPKLLRVLQDHEFERLGGTATIKVGLRLIAATNRDLTKSVAEQRFRSDLFYRLNVFPIHLPPLRERREDIPVLVRYFVRKFAARMERTIETVPHETMDALINWDWPGNVRELENFIERSVILTEGTALRVPLSELQAKGPGSVDASLENAEREHIIQILREAGGVVSGPKGAARRLGVKRTTLQSKIERLRITRRDYSGSSSE
ncbi:MAG: sigma 54-interacting transcriptional regulator [Candidatus Sulfotelmatobacter sp.]|jgi:formate hydrogenlyase transcriptional activator